jgi:hypothetical protein
MPDPDQLPQTVTSTSPFPLPAPEVLLHPKAAASAAAQSAMRKNFLVIKNLLNNFQDAQGNSPGPPIVTTALSVN